MKTTRKLQALLAIGAIGVYAFGAQGPASAKDISKATSSAFAVQASILGTEVIPPTPHVSLDKIGEASDTIIGIPAAPLAVNGTLIAKTVVSKTSDVTSELAYAAQDLPDEQFNVQAVGQIEDLDILLDEGVPGGKLIHAAVIRAEAVAVCQGPTAVGYSANSEVVDLVIGGDNSLTGPLNDLVKAIADGIHGSPLVDIVDVELNRVTDLPGGGVAVDALVVTVLRAAASGGAPGPLAEITLGHAEVTSASCANPLPSTTECSDGVDNDDTEDTLADALDPGCVTNGVYDPNDDDERNECNDTIDNADREDVLADADDPGCYNALGEYDPFDDDERDALSRTGMSIPTGLAAAMGVAALSMLAVRRRLA